MYQFRVDDMSCGHCASSITNAILAADSQAKISIDLESHQVSVDSDLEQPRVAEIITQAGYTPTEA